MPDVTPYTVQQVINNLRNMLEQLSDYPANLECGPGWCRNQCENILARGIEGDAEHPKRRPEISWTEDSTLTRYAVYESRPGGACAQSVSRPWIWASDASAAQEAVSWVMGVGHGVGVPYALP